MANKKTSQPKPAKTTKKKKPVMSGAQKRVTKEQLLKKKNKIIGIEGIVIAGICVAGCFHLAFDKGIFEMPSKAEMTMGDYSELSILNSDVEITDDSVDSEIETFTTEYDEEVTTGKAKKGSTVTATYTCYYDEDGEKGEEIEDESAESTQFTVGESGLPDGFDAAVKGQKIGDTIDVPLTITEDYSEDLAGTAVIYEVTLESRAETPELTDEFVAENSEDYYGEAIETVEALEEYVYDDLYEEALEEAVMTALTELQEVESYDEDDYQTYYDAMLSDLSYYTSMYGYDDDDATAEAFGYDDAESYAEDLAETYSAQIQLMDYMYKDLGLKDLSKKEKKEKILEYMEENDEGDEEYEDFLDEMGDAWYLSYTKVTLRMEDLVEALEDNIVFTDEEDTDDSEEIVVE